MKLIKFLFLLLFTSVLYCSILRAEHGIPRDASSLNRGTWPPERAPISSATMRGQLSDGSQSVIVASITSRIFISTQDGFQGDGSRLTNISGSVLTGGNTSYVSFSTGGFVGGNISVTSSSFGVVNSSALIVNSTFSVSSMMRVTTDSVILGTGSYQTVGWNVVNIVSSATQQLGTVNLLGLYNTNTSSGSSTALNFGQAGVNSPVRNYIQFIATWSADGSNGADLRFMTSGDGTTPTERMRLKNSGVLGLSSDSTLLGTVSSLLDVSGGSITNRGGSTGLRIESLSNCHTIKSRSDGSFVCISDPELKSTLSIYDEGTFEGDATAMNFVGDDVSISVSGTTPTVTITGSGANAGAVSSSTGSLQAQISSGSVLVKSHIDSDGDRLNTLSFEGNFTLLPNIGTTTIFSGDFRKYFKAQRTLIVGGFNASNSSPSQGVHTIVDSRDSFANMYSTIGLTAVTDATFNPFQVLFTSGIYDICGGTFIRGGTYIFEGSSAVIRFSNSCGTAEQLAIIRGATLIRPNFDGGGAAFISRLVQVSSDSLVIDPTFDGMKNQLGSVQDSAILHIGNGQSASYLDSNIRVYGAKFKDPRPRSGISRYGDSANLRVVGASNVVITIDQWSQATEESTDQTGFLIAESSDIYVSLRGATNLGGVFFTVQQGAHNILINGFDWNFRENSTSGVGSVALGESTGNSLPVSNVKFINGITRQTGTWGAGENAIFGNDTTAGTGCRSCSFENIIATSAVAGNSIIAIQLTGGTRDTSIINFEAHGLQNSLSDAGTNTGRWNLFKDGKKQ